MSELTEQSPVPQNDFSAKIDFYLANVSRVPPVGKDTLTFREHMVSSLVDSDL